MTPRILRAPRLKQSTKLQEERAARDLAIYNEYQTLVQIEGQSKTQIITYIMEKYDLHSNTTVYTIIKRMEERRKKEGGRS